MTNFCVRKVIGNNLDIFIFQVNFEEVVFYIISCPENQGLHFRINLTFIISPINYFLISLIFFVKPLV